MRLAYLYCVCNYKVCPIIDHEGPEVKQKYSSLSLTTIADGGWRLTQCPANFTPRKETQYTF